jgi:D-alanine--poly(phosphoribitol) ligase subunit 2
MPITVSQREAVRQLIAHTCGSAAVLDEPDADLTEAGLLDSLALVELLVGISEIVGLDIPPTDVDRSELATVNLILAFVDDRMDQ